ncbi:hypothetical protein M011DRAFT_470873 [Sporormia fimetaria CBS 119925]|uniref:Arrestin C-terminal-like domain-containing protein n=1 Tax=Sporormia fimetaria CBS 119925 TaxID=1340428 RepID=A0A6A6V2Z8_9PLEO|nr:hypothetical protein M011DRAFT_470873 [Sporormia fimetaria CBS 119925]
MTSSSTRGTVTSSTSLSSRSLLSRLTSPLQSKTRHFADFYILPDDPHRQYAPGDIISGSVILKVLKPLRITHLVISLHGYAQVYRNPNSPGDGYRNYSTTIGSGKGKKAGSYFGNGFVSLFEDEAVLCGEGRLAEGMYHFNFELEFPSTGLPSSIDFERGTISYMLTATLTRPTTISPITSCETKVGFQESIDVASIADPKPRMITLEPIVQKTRVKSSVRKHPLTRSKSASLRPERTGSESSHTLKVSETRSTVEDGEAPRSPAPSDVSFESQFSSGNASGTEYGIRSIKTAIGDAMSSSVKLAAKDKIITASIEVLKGGFLRGDQIPIKVSVQHTKHVSSLRGIIITLYRQARVDMHPALPVLPNSKGDKTKSEDYYPKSKTGLGGLSLSSAGSSHLFRKDLSQSFAPLYVDPRSLTTEVKSTVRVPDDAFPTISSVPGAMISFKYFVEVIVDIQGRLTRLDRVLPRSGLVDIPSGGGVGSTLGTSVDSGSSMFSTWGGNFVDTDALRREKGVIACVFEVVVGTKDTQRGAKARQQAKEVQADTPTQDAAVDVQPNDLLDGQSYDPNGDQYGYFQNTPFYDPYTYQDPYYGAYDTPAYQEPMQGHHSQVPDIPQYPETDESLTEKERLRRAEAGLLPSQPPGSESSGASQPSTLHPLTPSAPLIPEDDDLHFPYAPQSSSSSQRPPPFRPSAPSLPPVVTSFAQNTSHETSLTPTAASPAVTVTPHLLHAPHRSPGPTADHAPTIPSPSIVPPNYSPRAAVTSQSSPTDDKQELQRRRLEMERSAPPAGDHDDGAVAGPSEPPVASRVSLERSSSPVLEDHEERLVGAIAQNRETDPVRSHRAKMPSEDLPVYER